MKYNVKTIDIFLTPAIKDYLEKRISHLDKFVSQEEKDGVMCYAEIGKTTKHHKNGDFFIAELNIKMGGKSFMAKVEEYDLYAAIDKVTEEMAEELKTFKDKKTSLLKKSGAKIKAFIKGFYER